MNTEGKAVKHDHGKPQYELLPAAALEEVARVYTYGAAKYAPRNWELGLSFSRVFGALMRHCWAFWRGETLDPETGLHHMAHAAFGCLSLVHYGKTHSGTDDRPPACAESRVDEKQVHDNLRSWRDAACEQIESDVDRERRKMAAEDARIAEGLGQRWETGGMVFRSAPKITYSGPVTVSGGAGESKPVDVVKAYEAHGPLFKPQPERLRPLDLIKHADGSQHDAAVACKICHVLERVARSQEKHAMQIRNSTLFRNDIPLAKTARLAPCACTECDLDLQLAMLKRDDGCM